MDVYVQGKHKVTLTQADFKAQGGEGSVYVKGSTAYKVYTDANKMIPTAKVQELSVLTQSEIIRPQDILLDKKHAPIGYTMPHVSDAIALCQLFPKAFRDRKKLTPDGMLKLIRQMQYSIQEVHNQGILIVDLNETNFLTNNALDKIYFIDVDSYQTPGFPATALMDSVRDRHCQGKFSQETDWFSFAIVSFQMFVGIHPYKGKHPSLANLEARMQANVSVLDPNVSVPATCLPFDVIPAIYRDWYQAVLNDGKRIAPPDRLNAVIIITPKVQRQIGSNHFDIEELQVFSSDVLEVLQGLVVTSEGVVQGSQTRLHGDVKIGITPQNCRAIAAWIDAGHVRFFDLHRNQELPCNILGDEVMASEGRLVMRHQSALYEIEFLEMPNMTMVNTRLVGNVMPHATQMFEGVVVQNLLGSCYVSLLPHRRKCYQVRLPELEGSQIIHAKFQNHVLMLLGLRNGRYDKYVLRFGDDYQTYDLRTIEDVAPNDLNFTVLDNGLCLHMTDSDELEVFSHKRGANAIKSISDPAILGNCKLFKNGTQAMFARDNSLYKFTMRRS